MATLTAALAPYQDLPFEELKKEATAKILPQIVGFRESDIAPTVGAIDVAALDTLLGVVFAVRSLS